jgi:hypothetical protein
MPSLPPTLNLPDSYQLSGSLNLSKDHRLAILLNLLGLVLLVFFGWVFILAMQFLRPGFDGQLLNLVVGSPVEIIYFLISLLVVSVIMVVAHEAVHGLIFWLITRQRPVYGFRGLYAFASAPGWFIARNPYLVVAIAPFIAITTLGLGLMAVIPTGLILQILLLITLNASGAVGDLAVVFWLLTQPASIYVQDFGDGINLYRLKDR